MERLSRKNCVRKPTAVSLLSSSAQAVRLLNWQQQGKPHLGGGDINITLNLSFVSRPSSVDTHESGIGSVSMQYG